MGSFAVGSRQIHFVEAGAGKPVVLLHSGGLSSRQWGRLIAELATDHRVLAPDFYGYGGSTAIGAGDDFSFHEDTEAITALLRSLPEPAHLVGHSYGGFIGTQILVRTPELARSAAFFEPVAFGVLRSENDAEGLADLARVSEAKFLDDQTGGSPAWLEQFVDYWSGAGAFAALPPAARDSWIAVGRKTYLEVRSLVGDGTPLSAYRGIQTPTLLLSAERSTPAARRVCELLAAALPHGAYEALAGATHMAPLFEPARVNALLAGHVRKHD